MNEKMENFIEWFQYTKKVIVGMNAMSEIKNSMYGLNSKQN